MKQTVMENKSLLDIENDYMPINKFYIINKGNNDNDSISIRVPGHANSGYDRIQIWAWGNLNGSPFYGVVITWSGGDGSNPGASCTGTHNFSCTYENSGSDRIITVSGIPYWSQITFMSIWQII